MDLEDAEVNKNGRQDIELIRSNTVDVAAKVTESMESMHSKQPGCENEQCKQIKQRWKTFLAETSCHGMKILGNPTTPTLIKLTYGLVVLFLIVSIHITVIELATNALKYRSVTRTDVFVDSNMTFPTVTFCNACPYNFRGKNKSDPLYRILVKQSIFGSAMPNWDIATDASIRAFLLRPVSDVFNEYSMDVGLLFAEYDGLELDWGHFEPMDSIFGRCYQFNGPRYIKTHGPRLSSNKGTKTGLRLILNISQDDYGISEDGAAGIKLYITNPKSVPPVDTHGLSIMPGVSALAAIKTHQIAFLPSPYRSYNSEMCVDMADDSPDLVAKMRNSSVYNFETCRYQCAIYRASITCSCYLPDIVVPGLQPCRVQDVLFSCFSQEFSRVSQEAEMECDCPRPCTLTFYDVLLSTSQFPSKAALETALTLFNETDESRLKDYEEVGFSYFPGHNLARENVLEVRVFYETMLVRLEKHEPEFTFDSFLSSLGGQMGIYLGASIITLIEFAEVVVHTIICAIAWLVGRCRAN